MFPFLFARIRLLPLTAYFKKGRLNKLVQTARFLSDFPLKKSSVQYLLHFFIGTSFVDQMDRPDAGARLPGVVKDQVLLIIYFRE